ncbi:MAG TPA: DUF2934 domain-containing protein [Steroidobacteraceae bacterium]|nr:DUF2934 domain-containing protein [Steroidobacteraceae bacterium]
MTPRRPTDITRPSDPSPAPTARAPRKPRAVMPPVLGPAPVTPEERHALIAQNAYLRAERRGFAAGGETEDWLAAEIEVDALLRISHGGSPQ